jgi:hypothetical protein
MGIKGAKSFHESQLGLRAVFSQQWRHPVNGSKIGSPRVIAPRSGLRQVRNLPKQAAGPCQLAKLPTRPNRSFTHQRVVVSQAAGGRGVRP